MFKKIVALLAVMGLVLVIVGFVLTKGDFNVVKASFTRDEDYTFVSNEDEALITAVDLSVTDNNVTFYKNDTEKYKLEYYESEDDKITYSIIDGKLKIINKYKSKFKFFNFRVKSDKVSKISVYLPKSFTGDISTSVVSGEVNLTDFELESLTTKVTSGYLNIKNVSVKNNINFDVTSGKINFTDVNCTDINGDATSGRITINHMIARNNAILETTSGDIIINDSEFVRLNAKATSGLINVNVVKSDEVDTKIVSGKILIKLIGNKEDYKTILSIDSGKIYYLDQKLSSQTFNDSAPKLLKAKGNSGTIKIEFINN